MVDLTEPHTNRSSDKENRRCRVCLIGLPFADGQTRDGVRSAPALLRQSGLTSVIERRGYSVNDLGDLPLQNGKLDPVSSAKQFLKLPIARPVSGAHYTDEQITNCQVIGESCVEIADVVAQAARRKEFVLSIGGDHSVATGTIAGMLSVLPELCVIWIDAHGWGARFA